MMRTRSSLVAAVIVGLVAVVAAAAWYVAYGPGAPRKVGIIQLTAAIDAFPNGMKDGMAAFGYVEGRDISYDYVNVDQDVTRADAEIDRMLDQNVDVIYAITNPVLKSALERTAARGKRTPIVFVGVDKPVELGLIEGFSSSGNNATGIVGSVTENVPRQVALLRELLPKAKRIGIFGGSFIVPESLGVLSRQELLRVAPEYGFEVVEYKTDIAPDPTALRAEFTRIADGIRPGDIDAVFHLAAHWIPDQQFMEFALADRLGKVPNVMPTVEEVQDGGTFGYAPDLFAVGRDSAVLIDKILRGAAPESISVESPRHDVLWLNMASARDRGITFPDSLITKADHRIGEDTE